MTAAPHIDLAQRLEFLGITEEDRLCLKGLRPLFEAEADRFVATFYGRLLAFGPTRALLSNPKVRERLLLRQRGYMLSLAGSEIDESYVEDRFRIGYAHARVGVEPRWVLGAYSLYLRLLTPPIQAHFDGDQTRAERAVSALVKVLMLDAQLAMDAYFSERQEELEKPSWRRRHGPSAATTRCRARSFARRRNEHVPPRRSPPWPPSRRGSLTSSGPPWESSRDTRSRSTRW
jgi:hypothetical protein